MHRKLTDNEKKVFATLIKDEQKFLKTLTDEDGKLYLTLSKNQRNAVSQMDLKQRRNWFDEYGKKVDWATTMRKTIRENLYPIILETETNLAETKQFLSMMEMYVSQATITYTQNLNLETLKLHDYIGVDYPFKNQVIKILNLLAKEKVSDVSGILNGFTKMIEAIQRKEEAEKPFKELKIDWEKV